MPNRTVPADSAVAVLDNPELGERGFMRPTHDVRVDAHRPDAVRVTSPTRLKPGMRTYLQLLDQRRILRGEIDQCRVTGLEPLCYEAIFVFDQSLDMAETNNA